MRVLFAAAACAVLAACLSSCATVEEVSPVPPPVEVARPVAVPPVPETVVSWVVDPAGGYRDEQGFVRVDYSPCLPGQREAGGDELPPGGRLTVHLGYRDLRNANTAWYAFRLVEDGRILLEQDGRFDVPNIKGPDGYWWNDVVLDLPAQVVTEALLSVSDRRSAAAWRFVLRRVACPGS